MNTDQILLQIEQILDRYLLALGQIEEAHFVFKPQDATWSIAELYEHLCVSNSLFLQFLRDSINQNNGALNVHMNDRGVSLYAHGQFPNIRIKEPESLRELGLQTKSLETYPPRLQEFRKAVQEIKPQIDQDPGEYKVLHPVIGYLNALEWFKMIEMHMRHHLRQLNESQERAAAQ